jgi:hypothetical protein
VGGRIFTPDEANELLATVRPLAERMVRHRRRHVAAERRLAGIMGAVAGNGLVEPRQLGEARARVEQEAGAVARCAEEIQTLGVLVKDLDQGLLDFPARRGDEDIYLCWRVGEPAVAFWHGVDDGFAGRRPLPL